MDLKILENYVKNLLEYDCLISVQISCIFNVGSGWKPAAFDLKKPDVVTGTVLFFLWSVKKRKKKCLSSAAELFQRGAFFSRVVLALGRAQSHAASLCAWAALTALVHTVELTAQRTGGWHSQTSDVMKMAQKCLILMKYLSKRVSLLCFGLELLYLIPLVSACLEKELYLEEWEGGGLFYGQPKTQTVLAVKSSRGAKPLSALLFPSLSTSLTDRITLSFVAGTNKATFDSIVLNALLGSWEHAFMKAFV
ncbi:hypothetical protein EK904_012360 [Melospiza melodia maxima]|nr:hypothetical protein EK904_012360 [Melospiza melodia maxima]